MDTPKKNESNKKTTIIETPKKKHWFLKGCLIFFVLLIVLIGSAFAMAFRLPQKWGIVKSPAEKVFDDTPDRTSAKKVTAELKKSGMSTKGLDVYVLPLKDGSGEVAVVTLDASQGFAFSGTAGGDPFLGTMAAIAKTQLTNNATLKRVALDYKDETGATIFSATAPTGPILDFANGKISRDIFMKSIDGRLDIKNTVDRYQRNPLY